MPEARSMRVVARTATVVVTLGLVSGVFAFSQQPTAASAIASPPSTTSTTVAPPPSTTTTVAVPVAPPVTAPPTSAAPRRRVAAARPVQSAPAQTIQQRGEAALAMINFPWESLGYTISFEPARKGLLGMAHSGNRTIQIFVRENEPLSRLARTIAHELGHALDYEFITEDEASRYIAIRGINATPSTWFGCNGCTDYQTAAGDFAEVFQYWLLGDGEFLSQMGPKPTQEQLAQLGEIFVVDTAVRQAGRY